MRYLVIDAAASNAPFAARLTTTAFTTHSGRNTPHQKPVPLYRPYYQNNGIAKVVEIFYLF